jgi:predicted enzyme related to lactoylglutathione lyase
MGPGETYTMFKLRGKDVAAGYRLDPKKQSGVPPHWMLYVTTADADATAAKSAELGGETVAAPFDVFDAGRMAVLKDPVGATFCVWQPKSNPGIGIQNEPGSFCWGQLNTNDTAKSEAYYVALFGWDAKTGTVAAPRVRGAPARTAVGPARGLPVGPVARVVPFDLVMGDADPPEAGAVGERERGSGTRSHHGAMASTSGIAAASTIPTARFVSWVTHFKPTCVAVP